MCDRITGAPTPNDTHPLSVERRCLGAGRDTLDGDPLVTPLVQSTTFVRDGVGSDALHQYSRVSNPTVAALERTLGDLEDALPAVCFATGLAAETALFLGVLRAGDHVVCGRSCYGGTTRLLRTIFEGLGVTTTFVDSSDTGAIERAVCRRTRLIFVETPANPALELTDLRGVSVIAKRAGALLAVDNTFLTPVLQRPLDHGADVSVYSTTKFIEGHSTALGGSLVTRDPELDARLRLVRKSTGAIQSPLNAWLTINGIKTLPLRLRRQSETAATVARALAEHPAVKRVNHPSLAAGAARAIADRQHLGAHGAVVSFEVRGGLDAGRRLVEACRLCTLVEHVGSVETLITHPATMTHADVPIDQRREAGVTDGLLRLSVGLEEPWEILEDLTRTLEPAPERLCEGVAS
ncbi:MAG: PLP-dependent aspartate aminotransferase family protein [Phycisphaerales bacterium]